jgi:hypothetical protein
VGVNEDRDLRISGTLNCPVETEHVTEENIRQENFYRGVWRYEVYTNFGGETANQHRRSLQNALFYFLPESYFALVWTVLLCVSLCH